MQVYSNGSGDLIIESATEAEYKFEITDVNGALIYKNTFYQKSEINTGTLPPGIYFMTVSYKNDVYRKKIVIGY